ncbi:MAG: hypothetical protein O3B64_02195 [bacterium]|nr:hypothetical protein [bacterium]
MNRTIRLTELSFEDGITRRDSEVKYFVQAEYSYVENEVIMGLYAGDEHFDRVWSFPIELLLEGRVVDFSNFEGPYILADAVLAIVAENTSVRLHFVEDRSVVSITVCDETVSHPLDNDVARRMFRGI